MRCVWILFLFFGVCLTENTNVITMEKDFKKVSGKSDLPSDVSAVIQRLKTFKVPVHPRVRLLYRLLRRSVAAHALRAADSLYVPDKYN